MPPESIDPLLVQNEERHETLKDISTISQHQLLKQDEISEGVKDLNKTAEMLLLQGDEQKNQTFEIEANDANSLALWNLLRGPRGLKGDKGDKGDTGENAIHNPEIAIEALKNDAEFQAAVKGEKGDKGDKGEAGRDGTDGRNGRDGVDGVQGIMGLQGPKGEQGPRGERGLRGFKGDPGRDGKDVDPETVKEIMEKADFAVSRSSKTVSLSELDDVDLSQATISNGKYVIGGGGSGSGDVVGPGSSTNDNIAVFNGTTGKIIKDGGATISAINSAISAKQDSDADLTAVAGLSTTGIAVRTSAGTWAVRDLSYPAEGLTITNNAGIAGNPTFALANDLAALEGLSSTGIPIRTGIDTWSQRTLDTDGTLVANSDSNIATQKATKTYVDTMVAGLLDYRGGYNASGNVFPSTGGSGTAGAVMKGDMWVISNAGTLGGTAVQVGDSLIANVDTPGQTAGNWNILNGNISYVPEDVANKSTTTSLGTSDTLYPTQNAVKTYADTKALLAGSTSQAFSASQFEVGHASDTSITRVSAGIIAVEGVTILRTVDVDDTPVNGATTDPVSSNWAYDHAALASSDTVVGHVEIATSAETTTGTDATRAISPDGLAGSEFGKRTVSILVSDPNGDAITTGDGKAVFPIDTTLNGMNLVAVKGYLSTVSSSGAPNVQIRRSRRSSATARTTADMLSTALTIDASEFESADAATAAVINTSNDDVQTGDMIFVDIDGAGTGAKGLQVLLTFQLP
jgi:hypothetical protein